LADHPLRSRAAERVKLRESSADTARAVGGRQKEGGASSMVTLFAYLDCTTGSIILQAIMGGFAGVMVLARVGWRSIMSRFAVRTEKEHPVE
jgi:hypothetical protein